MEEVGYADDDAAWIANTLEALHNSNMAKGFQLHRRERGLQLSVEELISFFPLKPRKPTPSVMPLLLEGENSLKKAPLETQREAS